MLRDKSLALGENGRERLYSVVRIADETAYVNERAC